ncbi:MAG: DUF4982 domain-containing protein [Bacteroides sp.]|nr:DUF4982 domain-containing protein [Bacteroides sp.]MCM1390320.1 DUF4982 domain-containing protein [Bacteroides sp.]MCM1390899.1 DUF4982 domain-containing protein [Bacteroides sp.]
MKYRSTIIAILLCIASVLTAGAAREKYNFNSDWLIAVGDAPGNEDIKLDDRSWQRVTLPHAFNEGEAFKLSIEKLTDTVSWYRKHFRVPDIKDSKVFIEFEGLRQGADFYLNGKKLGFHENGITAVGFDLTPYIKKGDNVIAVRIDNDWDYRERDTNTKFQWNDKNFNANYGGIPKNVWLHVTPKVYQTLPLYSNLKTTGVYVYATDFDIPSRTATVNAESEVINETKSPMTLSYRVSVTDMEGNKVKSFTGKSATILPGDTATLSASAKLDDLNFWSWGYGYLYDVDTELIDDSGKSIDKVTTRTGFRKTKFGDGKIWLNDRVIMMHGYAQRTSNEWPAVGLSVPAWLSDYSNGLMVESGGNVVRWMHVTPWKQDVESCDRVGLIQAMPAGDSEKDREGRQWEQREEVMRDAIIYMRNNPSILFYESGNFRISRDHMLAMKAIRDKYDPYGGRAAGCREMLDVDDAEYGGEMLYINRSKKHPMWAMEYCRDEALRKYWDEESYPFHKEGEGPLYKGADASAYNRNQDQFAVEMVRRWYDYWLERPGSGDRNSSGGAKIIFSDTNTHYRGKENYRRSGVTDAMRIPKDAFFAHQVMWGDAWVDNEGAATYIVGHWNYPENTKKPVYVVSNGEDVELFLNGKSLGHGKRDYNFLFTFDNVEFLPGKLEAVSYDASGKEISRYLIETAGEPAQLRLTTVENPIGFRADGADMALLQVEVTDSEGRRCPLDNRMISFSINGPAEWLGGIAQGDDNYILSKDLPVECGINRALIRSTTDAGNITVTAKADGLPSASVSLKTIPVSVNNGLSTYIPAMELKGNLDKGPTPAGASYKQRMNTVNIASVEAGSAQEMVKNAYDDNENSAWTSDGVPSNSWITFTLEHPAAVSDITLKLTGWRKRSYPLEVYSGDQLIWRGYTPKGLGYVHIRPENAVKSDRYTIRQVGAVTEKDAFAIKELAGGPANEMDTKPSKKHQLSIVEAEFLENCSD